MPRLALPLALVLALVGCGVGKGAPQWIDGDAAVVRCTIAGRNLRLPRLLDAIPTPLPPSGLYAQTLDPIALEELGFERDRVVCASLQAPDDAVIETARAAIVEFRRIREQVSSAARDVGACACMQADSLDARGLLPGCMARPNEPHCAPSPEEIAALELILAPLREQLAVTELPRVHWRLFGRTDRIGRFAVRHGDVVGRHPGGSEVFVRGAPLPPRPGMHLIAALLGLDGVVAVVRQDSGRALLVVRELDDEVLILDHFAYGDPVGLEPEQASDLHALLGYLDDAQIAWFRTALGPPSSVRELQLDPRDGYVVELDHAGLERVDRAMLVMATLGGASYDEASEQRSGPPLLVDRVTLQVRFGTEGQRLVARLRLADEGRSWLAGAEGLDLRDAITGLGAVEQTPAFEPAVPGFPFILRGRPIEQVVFAGPSAGPKLLTAIEAQQPGSVEGEADDFDVLVPSGPLPGGFEARPGTEELREMLTLVPHRLRGDLVERGRVLELRLEPK